MLKRVHVATVFEIDTDRWQSAAVEAEYLDSDDVLTATTHEIVHHAIGYCDAEDHLPRWARDAMRVTSTTVEVSDG